MVSRSHEIPAGPRMAHTAAVLSRGTLPTAQASHSRGRTRRRQRSWSPFWTFLLPVFLVYSTFRIGLALIAVYLPCFDGDMASLKRAEERIS